MVLIEGGYFIDPKSGREGLYDVYIEGEKIARIGKNLRESFTKEELSSLHIIDASGLITAPGLVDVHVHFRDPGFTYKEDIKTGAAAAAKGGFTSVIMMANTKPVIDQAEVLKEVLEKGAKTGIRVYSCSTVTKGMQGKELVPMEELAECGAVGFTDDGMPLMDRNLVREAMERAAALKMPISFHEEDPNLIENNGVNAGAASAYYGIGGSKRDAETQMIERDLEMALETGACINIQHISTREGVELIRKAKRAAQTKNLKASIHGEATPHHFSLTEEAVITYGTLAKMNPPLREEADRMAIIEGLKDGTIDLIATDHAPHSQEEKSLPITEAPSGIIGLETSLALGITNLVEPEYLTLKELLQKMSTNPADMYGLDAGYLAEGGPGDLVLIHCDLEEEVGNYASKSCNTPFTGQGLKGIVEKTICGGKVIYEKGTKNTI
ncbi:dihydroorotase [Lachnospiraceae bacterium OttesenSCG-928-D06]|nr:dihydroorotase [Lachnospiraceae bacterium OttesenSCG-928-D06]